MRTAQVERSGRSTAPVRDVVERTTTRTETVTVTAPRCPAVRMSGQPYTLPEDVAEWAEALKALRTVAGAGHDYHCREQLAKLSDRTAHLLREAVPT